MEQCIADVMQKNGADRLRAILICKASIQKSLERKGTRR